ncbi:hypothetical protein KKI24_18070 [bacterium]|nr:hypothetical protein [bacterium]
MALITTHIRFALDLADRFAISDMDAYISGTVYPDSRWISGIDRELTHHERFRSPDFPTSDFTRGWQIHCVCDEIQNQLFAAQFPEQIPSSPEQRWVELSVAKLVQDMNDLQQFDLRAGLSHLDHVVNPNGEDIMLVQSFYRIIRQAYHHHGVPTPQAYKQLWLDVGLSEALANQIIRDLKTQLQNLPWVTSVHSTYDKMIAIAGNQTL